MIKNTENLSFLSLISVYMIIASLQIIILNLFIAKNDKSSFQGVNHGG